MRPIHLGAQVRFKNRPVGPLIGCEGAECSDLNRVNMSRMLDSVCEAGPERLFVHVAALVARRLGIRPRVFHLDSTSFYVKTGLGSSGFSNFP
ncbi:MAG: hypothetical protein SOT14_07740 [Succinivibrio sp.]|nr:hypothetical protein [Succinivibrio sp.]